MQPDEILARLDGVHPSGDGWVARCPSHEDHRQSLSLGVGDDGRVLLNCHAGCAPDAVCAALGLKLADLFVEEQSGNGNGKREIVATYDYVDEQRRLLYQVVRFQPKDFRQRRPDGEGGWTWKVAGTRRVLYRLPEVILAAALGGTVYVVEGEKDVHALEAAGAVATTSPAGAGKWRPEYSEALTGAHVAIVADRDEPGRAHAEQVARSLEGKAASVRVLEAAVGKDAADHLAAGKTVDELQVPAWAQPAEKPQLTAYTVAELRGRTPEITNWICYPYVAEGDVVSFESPPKDGKTTFVLAMVHAIATGSDFLGEQVAGGPVLYCTEERCGTFLGALERTKNAEGDNLRVVLLHDAAWRMKWPDTVAGITAIAEELRPRIVVLDTLSKWAGLHGDDEFSAGVAMATMTPLQHLASMGCAVAVIRHERKAGGAVGQAGRGSTAWTGDMDAVIAVRRIPGEKTKRLLAAIGRHDDTPEERIIDFAGDEYMVLGDPSDMRRLEEEKQIIDSLDYGEENGRTLNELRGDVSRRTAERIIGRLIRDAVVGHGLGEPQRGGRPRLYWLRTE